VILETLGRPDQPREPAGSPEGGQFASSDNPRVFNTPDDVELLTGWPGDAIRYQWKAERGHLVTGIPIARETLPDTLYHVTTNAPAVEKSGLLLGQRNSGGLGGGQANGVSFTTDLVSARVIQRELTRSVRIARGEDTIADIERYAREDEREGGLKAGTLDRAVASAREVWDGNISHTYKGKATYDTDEAKQSLVKDALNSYLWSRDTDAAGVPVLKNPILFGVQKQLRTIDPSWIKTLHVPSKNIPERALVTTGSDEFLHEARVYADVPIKGMRIASVLTSLILPLPPARAARLLARLVTAGSASSGNYGHAGRPGEVGGSAATGGETVKLYRGDSQSLNPSLSYSDPRALFGAGIYLTDSKRIAGDYRSKGADEGIAFRYSGNTKTTKQDAIDAYIRREARYVDAEGNKLEFEQRLHGYAYEPGVDVSAEWKRKADEDTTRIEHARKAWESSKNQYEVRKQADNTIIIRNKIDAGHVSHYDIPKEWVSKTLDAENEISMRVVDALHDTLRELDDRSTADDLYQFATRQDESGFRPSFRDVFTSIVDGPIRSEEGSVALRKMFKELGYKGIRYSGGQTMGGARHNAYVFWDEQGLKKARTLEFNEDQPRDERGRWTNSGVEGTFVDTKSELGEKEFVMQVDGKRIGQMTYAVHRNWGKGGMVEMLSLHVDPTYRGKGHGELLYRAFADHAKTLGVSHVIGDVTSAGVLKLGIKIFGQPEHLSDAINEVTVAKAMKRLEKLAPEVDGVISTDNYLTSRWKLKTKSYRTAKKYRIETLVHRAADKHAPKIEVAVRYAFAMGRKAVNREALTAALEGMRVAGRADQPRVPAGSPEGGQFASVVRAGNWAPDPKKDVVRLNFDFQSQADQYPEKGKPGVSYFKGVIDDESYVDALLWRDKQGKVRGIFNHYPMEFPGFEKKGNFNMMVDPEFQRQGIARQLFAEADRRWKLDLKQQTWTKDGRQFIQSLLKKPRRLESRDVQAALAAVADAPDAVAAALAQVLPQTLLAALQAGGEAGIAILQAQLRAAENLYHEPAGSPKGGQFASAPDGAASIHPIRVSGGPGGMDAVRVREVLSKLPKGLLRESKTRIINTAESAAKVADKIDNYLLKTYGFDSSELQQRARALVDREKGVIFTTSEPREVLNQFARTLTNRHMSEQWVKASSSFLERHTLEFQQSQKPHEDTFAAAFTQMFTSKPAQDLMSITNPLTAIIEHGPVKALLHEWGWMV